MSLFLLWILLLSNVANGGKVLFFFPLMPKSMLITFTPLASQLSSLGHEVTIVTPFPSGLKNVREIHCDKEGVLKDFMNTLSQMKLQSGTSETKGITEFGPILGRIARTCMNNEEIQALLKDKSTEFDAVVSPPIYGDVAGAYLAHRFNASYVMYLSIQATFASIDHIMEQPHNPAFMQTPFFPYEHEMNLIQRTGNVLLTFVTRFIVEWIMIPYTESLLDDTLPDANPRDRPQIKDLLENTSLSFHFGHPLLVDGNRATAQNTVYLGMMNCLKPNFEANMDPELKKFMDEAPNGVVFVSFGSFLQSSQMSKEHQDIFVSAFSKLKERVIWKWETENMEHVPPNLLLRKWLPQKEILAHPNLKLFVSHGGQSSFQETLCFQKPALFIPVQAEQRQNAFEGVKKGLGLVLPYNEVTTEKLIDSMEEMLGNDHYTQKAQFWGSLVMDQINRPLDRAVWWMEYVMRHKPCHHFRRPERSLNFIQKNLIDVYGLLSLILLLVGYINYKILKFTIQCICGSRRSKEKIQ